MAKPARDEQGRIKHVPVDERFWEKVDQSGGANACWPWTGPTRVNGYGYTTDYWKKLLAHRVAYELAVGPIPEGNDVCHSCDNPPCCNPRHLWTGTHSENLRDMIAKGRNIAPRGEQAGPSKLTESAVRAIRQRYDPRPRCSAADLAAEYGVHIRAIYDILNRKTWRHVE